MSAYKGIGWEVGPLVEDRALYPGVHACVRIDGLEAALVCGFTKTEAERRASAMAAAPELARALRGMLAWFKASDTPALSASELLLAGCPNELKADMARADEALALVAEAGL